MKTTNLEAALKLEMQSYRDDRSKELFGKPETLLNIGERAKLDLYMNDLNNPKWKEIVIDSMRTGYYISNTGLVIGAKGNLLQPTIHRGTGYATISVSMGKASYTLLIHRLVAISFIPNPENKPQVNHMDGRRSFNWAGNLEWTNKIESIQDLVTSGIIDDTSGVTEMQVWKVIELLEQGQLTTKEIAAETSVPKDMVHIIASKGVWSSISNKQLPMIDFSKGVPNEVVVSVCELLTNPNISYKYIEEVTGVPVRMVRDIARGHSYKSISSKYNIPKRESTEKEVAVEEPVQATPEETTPVVEPIIATPVASANPSYKTQQILNWVKAGKSDDWIVNQLMRKFGMPDRSRAQKCLSGTKRRYVAVLSSTTIDQPRVS